MGFSNRRIGYSNVKAPFVHLVNEWELMLRDRLLTSEDIFEVVYIPFPRKTIV